MKTKQIKTELCVIGGGLSGLCAAVSAARGGLRVVLVHDRPVPGGNASGEIRMWVRGASAAFPLFREGGIVEELAMDNIYYNPTMTYPVWDGILYHLASREPNLTLLLNTTCHGAEYRDRRILCIRAWQLTTYTEYEIQADYFADCSGDSVLSEFTPAAYRRGREGREEFGESHAPPLPDDKTMGMSCLIQGRETAREVPYRPLPFAQTFRSTDFPHRMNTTDPRGFMANNFWWIEKGGERDTLRDAEAITAELRPAAYGVWDFVKNSGVYDSRHWELEFVGQLGGKRESRRYKGKYTLTQQDIECARPFEDEVAYGGWTMDDHDPAGMDTTAPPNVHYPVPGPYPIPYRVLYSENMENLFFAGRNISVTHMALSSTRVMATCALLGQAVGNAAVLAGRYGCSPHGVLSHIAELQQALRDDDCYLLHTPRRLSDTMRQSRHNLTPQNYRHLLQGIERKTDEGDSVLLFRAGETAAFEFEPTFCAKVRLVFDNDIQRDSYPDYNLRQYPARHMFTTAERDLYLPPVLVSRYEISLKENGVWQPPQTFRNHQRLTTIQVDRKIEGISFRGLATHGGGECIRLYSIDVIP
ncbi:MAG: FAD-dependent oxidoreductase [Eubacteriales bacterium]